jgi:hypothetical protein
MKVDVGLMYCISIERARRSMPSHPPLAVYTDLFPIHHHHHLAVYLFSRPGILTPSIHPQTPPGMAIIPRISSRKNVESKKEKGKKGRTDTG